MVERENSFNFKKFSAPLFMPRNKKGCLEEINKIAFNMEKWMGTQRRQ